MLPDVLPALLSTSLYIWAFNIRSSTVLGLVGAGGIGRDLKNAVDLLDFPTVAAIILIILAIVTAIDQVSAWLRRRLLLTAPTIDVKGLGKRYDGKPVLSGVRFTVTAGEVVALLRVIAHEAGITVLCSPHQVDLLPGFADRVLGLRAGRLVPDSAIENFQMSHIITDIGQSHHWKSARAALEDNNARRAGSKMEMASGTRPTSRRVPA